MSDPDAAIYRVQEQTFEEYEENDKDEYEESKTEKLKKAGIHVPINPLSDSIHPKTQASYDALNIPIPDTVRYASQRPTERLKHMIEQVTGKPVKTTILGRKICRLKDAKGKEWIYWDYEKIFKDLNGNKRSLSINKGCHEEIVGDKKRDVRLKLIGSTITKRLQVYDIPFTKKELAEILRKCSNSNSNSNSNNKDTREGEDKDKDIPNTNEDEIQFLVGYTSQNVRSVYTTNHPIYVVKNQQDFLEGSWEQLYEMGQRGLSKFEPSLARLKQPIAEDPNISLLKKERYSFITPSDRSTFSQSTYR